MIRGSTLLVVVTSLIFVPVLASAQSSAGLTKMRMLDPDGDELRIAPKDGFLTLETIVNNTGTDEINGTLTLAFKLEAVNGGFTDSKTLTAQGPLASGASTSFKYGWASAGRDVGDYRATAQLTKPASPSALVATFTVADNGVAAGNLTDRVVDYYWFFGLFLVAIILFFVVLAARRA